MPMRLKIHSGSIYTCSLTTLNYNLARFKLWQGPASHMSTPAMCKDLPGPLTSYLQSYYQSTTLSIQIMQKHSTLNLSRQRTFHPLLLAHQELITGYRKKKVEAMKIPARVDVFNLTEWYCAANWARRRDFIEDPCLDLTIFFMDSFNFFSWFTEGLHVLS